MHKYCTINSIISQEKNANYVIYKTKCPIFSKEKNANYLKAEKTTKNVKKVSNNAE